jgi:metallophosphoesterase (TIGR00282 family)
MRIVMLGDIVGKPGRRVVQQQLAWVREAYAPDYIVANAENIAGGSGITQQLYQKLRAYGIDGVTLGDHAFRQKDIYPAFASATELIRPANLPESALGRGWMKLQAPGKEPLYVVTLLGRLFMNGVQADDPFAAADRIVAQFPKDAKILIEVHAEATSEKVGLGHHLDGRVAAVVGTHTHIPTADAKVLPGGTAYMTDLGMCGPYDSILGRRKERVLQFMTTAMPAMFDVAEDDTRMCGVFIELQGNRAVRCERLERPAELGKPPFDGDGD